MRDKQLENRVSIAEVAIRRLQGASSSSDILTNSEVVSDSFDPLNKPKYWSDFPSSTSAQNFPVSFSAIASGTISGVAQPSHHHPGVISLNSSASLNSGAHQYFFTSQTANYFTGGERTEWVFSPRIASNTNTTIRFGFLDATTSADAVDGGYFEMAAGSLAIFAKTSSNSVRTTSGALATLVQNSWYRGVVTCLPNASGVLFEIFNDTEKLLGSTLITSNIPNTNARTFGCGFVATNSAGGSVQLVHLDYGSLEFGYGFPLIR